MDDETRAAFREWREAVSHRTETEIAPQAPMHRWRSLQKHIATMLASELGPPAAAAGAYSPLPSFSFGGEQTIRTLMLI
jgi:hypothetical protein